MKHTLFFWCLVTYLMTSIVFANHAIINDTTSIDSTLTERSYVSSHLKGGFTIGARMGASSYLYFSPFLTTRIGRFYPGVGVSFSQYIQNDPYIKEERVGIRGLVRYHIYKSFFASVEYDGQKNTVATENGYEKQWTNNLLIGGGIAIPITYDSHLTFELLYQANYKAGYSPYGHKQMLGRIGLFF
jgi:hypothetical protein